MLPDLGTLANLGTMVAVVVAVVFGIAQVRQNQQRRRDQAASEMLRAALTPQFVAALDRIASLPDHAPLATIGSKDEGMMAAVRLIAYTYESLGWMVYRRILELHAVDELMGGTPRLAWRKLDHVIQEQRKASSPNYGEWFEWLVIQLEAHPVEWKARGAHVAKRDWRP